MRLLIAALLGGTVLLFWGFVSHMLLPVAEMGHEMPTSEDVVIAGLKEGLPAKAGVYYIPGLAPDQYEDAAAVAAYSAKAVANPYAFVIYQPVGRDGMQMGPQMAIEWATSTVSALMAAWILSLGAFGFGKRVGISIVLGLFAWAVISVPYWNWYRFPTEFTLGSLIITLVGWLAAGLVMAGWLGRKGR